MLLHETTLPASLNVAVSESRASVKGDVRRRTSHERPEGRYKYFSTFSLTSALDGVGWSTPRPGCFTSGKETRYPLYWRLGGPQGRSGRM